MDFSQVLKSTKAQRVKNDSKGLKAIDEILSNVEKLELEVMLNSRLEWNQANSAIMINKLTEVKKTAKPLASLLLSYCSTKVFEVTPELKTLSIAHKKALTDYQNALDIIEGNNVDKYAPEPAYNPYGDDAIDAEVIEGFQDSQRPTILETHLAPNTSNSRASNSDTNSDSSPDTKGDNNSNSAYSDTGEAINLEQEFGGMIDDLLNFNF